MKWISTFLASMAVTLGLGMFPGTCAQAFAASSYLAGFSQVSTISSTLPPNGDVNPYGLVRVPVTMGNLREGNLLISNFNDGSNLQGTGTTIVQITPDGTLSVFAQLDAASLPGSCPGGVGLTTALAVLRSGWVIVGSLPTTDGTAATAQAGCLIVLNSMGEPVATISGGPINGPWDMTAFDAGTTAVLFVTNVLNGTVAANGNVVHGGTVVRLTLNTSGAIPRVTSQRTIGSGFAERTDPAALVIGPTGVAMDVRHDILYVADSGNSRIAAISAALQRQFSARTGVTVSSGGHLNDPLGMTLAPNGDIVTVNGDDGFIVETTPQGRQIDAILIDDSGTPPGSGALFGVLAAGQTGVYFVDDATNSLNLLH